MLPLALRLCCASRDATCRAISLAQRSSARVANFPSRGGTPNRCFSGSLAVPVRGSRLSCAAGWASVDVNVASRLLREGSAYVDVRTSEEYAAGHVPSAANVPVMVKQGSAMVPNPDFLQQFEAAFPDKSVPLCVGCQSGKRSEVASKILADAGYSNVTNVEGGFMAWTGASLPVEA